MLVLPSSQRLAPALLHGLVPRNQEGSPVVSHLQNKRRGSRAGQSRSVVLALGAALALAFLATPTTAQLTGRLAGQVMDAEGAPLPGATVTVNSPNLMGSRTDFADAEGGFSFPSLPPGVYTIDAELDGFVPQRRTEVEVSVSGATEIHISMAVGEFGEEVVVTAETPVVDPEQVSTSYHFSTDYLKKASVGSTRRSYQSVLQQAAGVAGGANPNVFGSTLGENTWIVDGVDTTDPVTATFNINLGFDSLQVVDFETGGYEARYGRSTGGIVNAVTKSGGNEFEGTADIRYRDTDFTTDGEHFDKNENITERRNPEFTFGGPFQRDKLWFFTSFMPVRSKSTPTESLLTRDFEGTNVLGKVTWQTNPSWQVVGRYLAEDATIDNSNASRTVAPEAASFQEQPVSISGVEVLGVPAANLQWFFKAGLLRSELNVFPRSRDFDTIGHTDRVTSTSTVNYTNQQFSNRDRDDIATNLTWFTDGAAGDHELQLGVEHASNLFRTRNDATGGGYSYSDSSGSPFILNFSPLDPFLEYDSELYSLYVQDTWRVGDVTLKVGLRNDQTSFTNDAGTEVTDLSKLQPRLGLAWDLTGDAKTVARANWSRSMHPNALTLPSFARARRTPSMRYISCSRFIPAFFGATPEQCAALNPGSRTVGDFTVSNWIADPSEGFDPHGWFFFDSFSSQPATVQPGLDPTYVDTWILAVERELTRRTSIGLTYVDKETFDIFEDTCNGNVPIPMAGADCTFYTMVNLPEATRDYNGLILDFESRFADWIHVVSSYTYSESKGNVGYTQNAGVAFDIYPDHFHNRYGFLGDHRKHRVKINGYVALPLDFTIGFVGFWSSPFVYSATQAQEDPSSYGLDYTEPRGSREANENYRLDLEVRKGFNFGNRLRFQLIAAVYNAFDQEQVTAVCGRLEGCAGVAFGDATTYRQPRNYEAGIRFEF